MVVVNQAGYFGSALWQTNTIMYCHVDVDLMQVAAVITEPGKRLAYRDWSATWRAQFVRVR